MTAFAAIFVSDRLVEDASRDELALSVLVGIVGTVEYYESQTDEDLAEWTFSHERSIRQLADLGDWDEADNHRYEAQIVAAVLDNRAELRATEAAMARYSFTGPLTHNPFTGLAA